MKKKSGNPPRLPLSSCLAGRSEARSVSYMLQPESAKSTTSKETTTTDSTYGALCDFLSSSIHFLQSAKPPPALLDVSRRELVFHVCVEEVFLSVGADSIK